MSEVISKCRTEKAAAAALNLFVLTLRHVVEAEEEALTAEQQAAALTVALDALADGPDHPKPASCRIWLLAPPAPMPPKSEEAHIRIPAVHSFSKSLLLILQ